MINCKKLKGEFTKQISLRTNDAAQPTITLYCKGKILEPMVLTPNRLNFGAIDMDQLPVIKKIEIKRGDGGPITPVIKQQLKAFKTELNELKKGDLYELTVTLDAMNDDRAREDIVLSTGVSESPSLKLTAFARRQPRVTLKPPRFTVPKNDPTTTQAQQKVDVAWRQATQFEVLDVKVNDPKLTVEKRLADGKQTVVLTVPPGYNLPSGARFVTVITSDPQSPTVQIPVRSIATRRSTRNSTPAKRSTSEKIPAAKKAKPTAKPKPRRSGTE
jgi:hypothetical protein